MALNGLLVQKGYDSVIAMDERTTRLLIENPKSLKKLMEYRLHISVEMRKTPNFEDVIFLRSTELIYVAWKKGLVQIKDKGVLDAMLYALKYKGAAISSDEIEEIKRLS